MNPFVNLKKRSILLPTGCKDLIDVLPPPKRTRRADETPVGQWTPVIEPERIDAAGLAHVRRYITRLSVASGQFTVLHITSLDAQMRIVLYRSAEEFSVYALMGLADRERAVEDFFSQRAIQPSADFFVGHPGMPTRVLGYPLPVDVTRVGELTIDLIRLGFGLNDEAGHRNGGA